jgi:hypothetical protein
MINGECLHRSATRRDMLLRSWILSWAVTLEISARRRSAKTLSTLRVDCGPKLVCLFLNLILLPVMKDFRKIFPPQQPTIRMMTFTKS